MPQDRLDMLRQQIMYFGCDHPIITWHRIIVYGYEEYTFCEEFQLPFTIKELEYNFRSEVINYVSKKFLYLDYLTDEWNRYCIGKFYESKKQLLIDNYPIPSWISSIERTCSSADFEHATPEVLDKLGLKLQILQEAINILIAATKGESIWAKKLEK